MTSRFAESYRNLRTNIHFRLLDKEFGSLLFTSGGELEGKSTTVLNLAYTMAKAGKTVIMVDADLRRPGLSNLFTGHDSPGLSGLVIHTFNTEVRSGSLGSLTVSDILWLLSFQKKSGVLCVKHETERIDIYFRQGELVDVQWLTRPNDRRLASLLVMNKVLNREQVDHALAQQKSTGQRLGFVLINLGLIKMDDLSGFLSLQMIEALRAALSLKTGTFSFERLPESHFERLILNPVDLPTIYRQVTAEEKGMVFIENKINQAIIKTRTENLYLLPGGPLPPEPAEMLSSKRMSFLLSYLKMRFDMVLIDTPPILPASDALILAPETEGVVLIVKAGDLSREVVKKAIEQLHVSNANLLGVVLNQVDLQRDRYYKESYYEYYAESD